MFIAGRGGFSAVCKAPAIKFSVSLDGKGEIAFPSGKVLARALKPGERYTLRSGGGGGYGSPLSRPDRKRSPRICRKAYITPARAERLYGIVFGSEPGTIDSAKTPKRAKEQS